MGGVHAGGIGPNKSHTSHQRLPPLSCRAPGHEQPCRDSERRCFDIHRLRIGDAFHPPMPPISLGIAPCPSSHPPGGLGPSTTRVQSTPSCATLKDGTVTGWGRPFKPWETPGNASEQHSCISPESEIQANRRPERQTKVDECRQRKVETGTPGGRGLGSEGFMDDFFNKALDSLEKSVVEPFHARAAEIVEEYPTDKNEELPQTKGEEAVQVAQDARLQWEEFDLASKLESWKQLLNRNENVQPAPDMESPERNYITSSEAAGATRLNPQSEQSAKAAEQAFHEVLSELSKLPDPSNAFLRLQRTVKDLTSVEQENESLLAELEVVKRDARSARGFKQQIKALQEELTILKENAESSKTQQLQESSERFEQEKRELVATLKEEVSKKATMEERVSQLTAAKQVAEEKLLEVSSELEAIKINKQNELDEFAEELDSSKARIKDLERQLQESNASDVGKSEGDWSLEREGDVNASIMVPQEMLWDAERELSDTRNKLQGCIEELALLKKRSEQEGNALKELQQQLEERPTLDQYNRLKNQLETIPLYLESGKLAEDSVPGGMASNGVLEKIKHLLDARCKDLDAELSSMQAKIDQYEKLEADRDNTVEQLRETALSQEKTIAKLEADLLVVTNLHSAEEDPDQFLNVIVSQRDRLKSMNDALSLEVSKVNGKLESMQMEKDRLEKDNLALFEKAKYMEHWAQNRLSPSYEAGAAQGGADSKPVAAKEARFACGPVNIPMGAASRFSDMTGARRRFGCFGSDQESTPDVGPSGPLEERYGRAYAAKLNPFQEFTTYERQKEVRRLRLGDRVAFMMGQMIGNQVGRIFLVIYIMLLHLLVFSLVIATML